MALEWVVRYAAGADAIMPLQQTPPRLDVLRHRSLSTSTSLYPLTLLSWYQKARTDTNDGEEEQEDDDAVKAN
ncbi:hypothetical protein ACQJBY_020763 [Aegilops geniculata]